MNTRVQILVLVPISAPNPIKSLFMPLILTPPYLYQNNLWINESQPSFTPLPVAGVQQITNNTNSDTAIIVKCDCDLPKMLPILHNMKLWYDTLIGLKNYYDDIELYLTDYIKKIIISIKLILTITYPTFLLPSKSTFYTHKISRNIKLFPRT